MKTNDPPPDTPETEDHLARLSWKEIYGTFKDSPQCGAEDGNGVPCCLIKEHWGQHVSVTRNYRHNWGPDYLP